MEQKKLKLMSWPIRLPSTYFTGFLMINHPPVEGDCEFGWGKPYEKRDDEFLNSLCDYFDEIIKKESLETGSVVWGSIVPTHAEFIEMLKNRELEKLHEYLRYMFRNPLTFGLAQGEYFYNKLKKNDDDLQKNTGFAIYDKFLCLLEAVGLIPTFSPEQYQQNSDFLKYYTVEIDKYLEEIEDNFNCKIQAPKYQGDHFGIQTKNHGLFSDRDIMALGSAIRILESFWNRRDIRIADIGAGLGYLIYYLNLLGFKNLTHIDIPTVAVAAKYFQKTNMPDVNIQYVSPKDFTGEYDLVVNIDGLSTYNREVAQEYMDKTSKNASHFISVNRECDDFRVHDVCNMRRISRNPFWYRRGYVEEEYIKDIRV